MLKLFSALNEVIRERAAYGKKRRVRRNKDGIMCLAGDYNRYHKRTKPFEEEIAEKLARENRLQAQKEKEITEYNAMLNYFGIDGNIIENNSKIGQSGKGFSVYLLKDLSYWNEIFGNDSMDYHKFIYLYNEDMKLPKDMRISADIFHNYPQSDWKYIFQYHNLYLENNERFVNSELFYKLVEFLDTVAKNDLSSIYVVVKTVLDLNISLKKKRLDLYVSPIEFIDLLPFAYITANKRTKSTQNTLIREIFNELAAQTGKDHIFYYQYKVQTGEDANKEFWEKYT